MTTNPVPTSLPAPTRLSLIPHPAPSITIATATTTTSSLPIFNPLSPSSSLSQIPKKRERSPSPSSSTKPKVLKTNSNPTFRPSNAFTTSTSSSMTTTHRSSSIPEKKTFTPNSISTKPSTGYKSNTSTSSSSSIPSSRSTSSLAIRKTLAKPGSSLSSSTSSLRSTTSSNSTLSSYKASSTINKTSSSMPSKSNPSSNSEVPIKKKRPAWDLKGRIEDMEKAHELMSAQSAANFENSNRLMNELEEERKKVHGLESKTQTLQSEVYEKQQKVMSLQMELAQLRQEQDFVQDRHRRQLQLIEETHQNEFSKLKIQHEELNQTHFKLKKEYEALNLEHSTLTSTFHAAHSSMTHLEVQSRSLKLQLDSLTSTLAQKESKLQQHEEYIQQLEQKLRDDETVRRQLHNTIQELKGNIRVFCRIRPALEKEKSSLSNFTITAPDGVEFQETRDSADGKTSLKSYPFQFDRVFGASSTQAEVFAEISQLVQSALDGYNVCIFAYGQTGSGKTYTMEGLRDEEHLGMIPRAVHQLFDTSEQLKSKGWEFKFEGTFLEIYNEQLRDLLDPSSSSSTSSSTSNSTTSSSSSSSSSSSISFLSSTSTSKSDESKKLEIRHLNQKTVVSDATVLPLTSPRQVLQALDKASKQRAVGATLMNERSSRSHSVFTVSIVGIHATTLEQIEAKLNLVDLAGSERLNQSGATGDRLKETQNINKSLSSLGDVIMALANRDPHIPYRNSKLTYLLQHSLGGNSKTLMFVNISPSLPSFNESLNSLRFATKVNACQIGTARKVVTSKS